MVKILFDISVLKAGFSGIPQDSRRIFKILESEDCTIRCVILDVTRNINIGAKTNSHGDILSVYRNAKDMSVIWT